MSIEMVVKYAELLNRGIDALCPDDRQKCIYENVYRGSGHCDELANCDDIREQQVTFKGFTSTSIDPNEAYDFSDGRYFFYINDTKGLDMDIFTEYPDEEEILIPANTVFKVLEFLKSNNSDNERDEITARLKAHGVIDIEEGEVNAEVYISLEVKLTCKCGLTFPNLFLVMVVLVMVKAIL